MRPPCHDRYFGVNKNLAFCFSGATFSVHRKPKHLIKLRILPKGAVEPKRLEKTSMASYDEAITRRQRAVGPRAVREQSQAAFALSGYPVCMRTIIYVDGFNLYYRLLDKRSALKWLNLKTLAEQLLQPANVVVGVRYYTAHISGRVDPTAPARQQLYLDALRTIPEMSIHFGTFLTSKKFAGLVHPPNFRPQATMSPPWPDVVQVIKVEEKGSDVNLACHLLLDAFQGKYDVV